MLCQCEVVKESGNLPITLAPLKYIPMATKKGFGLAYSRGKRGTLRQHTKNKTCLVSPPAFFFSSFTFSLKWKKYIQYIFSKLLGGKLMKTKQGLFPFLKNARCYTGFYLSWPNQTISWNSTRLFLTPIFGSKKKPLRMQPNSIYSTKVCPAAFSETVLD